MTPFWAALVAALALAPRCGAQPLPRYGQHHAHACLTPTNTFPFCDTSLDVQDRVADLLSRMSMSEKVADTYDLSQANAALGLDAFNYNQEGLHGLGAQCFAASATSGTRCPSVFAAPPTLGASWNRTLLKLVGDAISTEARAYNNFGGNRGYQNRPVDLQVWMPSINIARDPRWGRQVETYSEDPWAVGQFGAHIIEGAQRGADGGASGNGYLKVFTAVKHATAYQIENNRFARNENITLHDLSDTFYPAWEAVMEEGQATGFMCAYPAINGVPCCGDSFFMNELMRDTWGMGSTHSGGSYVQGDCGAIENIASAHHYAVNNTFGAAVALNAGANVDCGNGLPGQVALAIEIGLTTAQTLDESLTQIYTLQFLAGRFDPIESQPYMSLPFEAIDSPAHQALAFESGIQGMVLLRNDAGLLPLPLNADGPELRTIAIVGPLGDSNDLAGNYYEQRCPSGGLDCIPTLRNSTLAVLSSAFNTVLYAQGCAVDSGDASGIPAAVNASLMADLVVLALGTNSQVAQEGNDRDDTSLPGQQHALAMAVLAAGKPTVVLLFNGGTMAIDDIVALADPRQPLAIVENFFPGESGGAPIVSQLFAGGPNRWGKLPVTFYNANFTKTIPIDDMRMVSSPSVFAGRGYRYYDNSLGPSLWPFGFGLSYTTFALAGSCPQVAAGAPWRVEAARYAGAAATDVRGRGHAAAAAAPLQCSVTVTNTGELDGDEVVFLFITPGALSSEERAAGRLAAARAAECGAGGPMPVVPDALAIKQLAGFERVRVPAGGQVVVPFSVNIGALAFVNEAGDRVVRAGAFGLEFSRGHGDVLRVPVFVEVEGGAAELVARAYPKRASA